MTDAEFSASCKNNKKRKAPRGSTNDPHKNRSRSPPSHGGDYGSKSSHHRSKTYGQKIKKKILGLHQLLIKCEFFV